MSQKNRTQNQPEYSLITSQDNTRIQQIDVLETIEFEVPTLPKTSATGTTNGSTRSPLIVAENNEGDGGAISEAMVRGLLDQGETPTQKRKMSQIYLYWAALGAVLMALASVIRGIESATPLPVKFALSLSYLILSLLMLAYYKCRLGVSFQLPWRRQTQSSNKDRIDSNSVPSTVFSRGQFFAIIVGGVSEFVTSISVIMAFSAAQKANINQGIGSNIMICNSVVVTILSYCFLGEAVSKPQFAGILIIIGGVGLVSLFPPEVHESTGGDKTAVTKDDSVAAQMALVVMWGTIGAVFLSFEIMSNKWLMIRRGINGDVSGMFFLLVEGIIGTLCLIVTTAQGSGLYELSAKIFGMVLIAGFLAFTALVFLNYAISKGLAGVAISIFNTNATIQVILSSLFLHQAISIGQIWGVVLSLVGACLLTLGDMLIDKVRGMKTTSL